MPRPRRSSSVLTALAALLALSLAAPAPAPRELRDAEHTRAAEAAARRAASLRQATAQAEQLRLAAARVQAAAGLRAADQAVQEASARLEDLAGQRRRAEQDLAGRAAQMVPLLPLLERLSLFPTETLLAGPGSPEATLRGVLVLRGLARELETDAAALREQQRRVAALSARIAAALPALQAAQQAQAAGAAALDRQIEEARQTEQDAADAAEEAARQEAEAAARADNLRGAITQMQAARRAAEARARAAAARAERLRHQADLESARAREASLERPAGPGLEAARGSIAGPVVGRVVRGFGDPGDGGPANGMSYAAAPAARVVAPCAGRSLFAGPFRSFGLLLILDCGGGYDFVLAGLQRLDVTVGQPVQAGEPVGVMPNWDPQSSNPRPVLYVELRRDGQPVDPAPWLKAKG
jgi:septal ring factor EnvC (AmiA/AmiB activator)